MSDTATRLQAGVMRGNRRRGGQSQARRQFCQDNHVS